MFRSSSIRRRWPSASTLTLAWTLILVASSLLWAPALGQATPPQPDGVEALIAPYRDILSAKMGEVLADCPVEMRAGDPEGPLGNLVCDIVLERARQATGLPVDLCVLNNGGLRATLPPGPITLGLVYEIMPFDNEIVVLRLSGPQIRVLADQIAAGGGEPVAGISLTIRDGRADGLLVGQSGYYEPVADREYLVATSDYLANRAGGMEALWNPIGETVVTGVLIRDALVDAFRAAGAQSGPKPGAPRAARVEGQSGPKLGSLSVPEMGRVTSVHGGAR
jgi:2',3'-cyclic-nucleotide 2'-phosphodiesterase (5'-nucleotidase family)